MIFKRIALVAILLIAMTTGVFATGETEESASERPTLKYLSGNRTFDLATDYTATQMEEMTGYEVEYFMLPAENAMSKLQLELSSGVDYDYIQINFADFVVLSGKNIPLPLNDLIEKHGPNIEPLLETEPQVWNAVTIDDNILGIPSVVPRDDHGQGIALNGEYLGQIGMEVPETLEEFEAVLRAIDEEVGVIPMAGRRAIESIIGSAFGITDLEFSVVDGEVVSLVRQEGLLDYLEYMAELYDEGLIDPEWPVNTNNTVREKFASGQAATIHFGWWELPGLDGAIRSTFPDVTIEMVRPLIGPDGTQAISRPSGLQDVGFIPRTASHEEHVVQWLNSLYQPDNFVSLVIGEEGVHYEVRDGAYWPIQPAFSEDKNNAYAFYAAPPGLNFGNIWQARVRRNEIMYAAFEELDRVPDDIKVINPTAFAANLEAVATYREATTEVFNNWALKVIAGAESIDTYDEMLSDWMQLGGAEMEAEVQEFWANAN